jgi:amino acid permease
MSKNRPESSWIADLVGTVGLIVCVLPIFLSIYDSFLDHSHSSVWVVREPFIAIQLLILGFVFIILSKCIQKFWNIEFYLEHLANNSHQQIPDYKPLSEQRKPQQDKPSNPESDMSKYAPK